MNGGAGAELRVDVTRLDSILGDADPIRIRLRDGQAVSFSDGLSASPIMVAGEFAQVIHHATFTILVLSPTPWQNQLNHWDVDRNGIVTALDALSIVNQLRQVVDPVLPEDLQADQFAGHYYDVSGDGRLSALDALRVVNEMRRRRGSAEAEWIQPGVRDVGDAEAWADLEPGLLRIEPSKVQSAVAADTVIASTRVSLSGPALPFSSDLKQAVRPGAVDKLLADENFGSEWPFASADGRETGSR